MAECGSAQELRAPNVGAGQAGAAGAPGAGWRPSRGRGLTELEEAEPGRRAGWLGGRSATGKRRREGEGQARVGEAERAAPATVWPRGNLGREGRNTRPAASSRRKRLSLSPWQSTLERTAAQQGRDKALAALRPAARQRPLAAQGAQLPFYPGGDLSEQLPSQLPLRRQNWLCPWPHPPASVKEEKGPFARGQGHLLPRGLALPHEELQCVSRGAG